MLYNVLIIDDETLIRTGLRRSVPWRELGFRVAAEAATAEQALEQMAHHIIDLVLVDIQMPGVNGIEFIREMKRISPSTKALIISGHSDFEYTVSALQLEVCDYLLKPINIGQLNEAVQKVRQKIEAERERFMVNQNQKHLVGKMLALRLIGKDFANRDEVDFYCIQCGIPFPLTGYCVVAAKFAKWAQTIETHYHGNKYEIENDLDECLHQAEGLGERLFFTAFVGEYYTVVAEQDYGAGIRACLYQKAKEMGDSAQIATGDAFGDIYFMDVSYIQAVEKIRNREDVIHREKKIQENQRIYLNSLLIQKLEERKFDEIPQVEGQIFEQILSKDDGKALNWCINSIYSIVDYFQLSQYEEVRELAVFPIQSLSSLYFMNTIWDMYVRKVNRIIDILKEMRGNKNEMIVNKMYKLIKEAYFQPDLSLQRIADQLGMKYTYLSTLFKQVSGENFSSYLTELRLHKAKQMILENKMKMYEIAEAVGYVSAKYFAEQFKKNIGMTPSEYRAIYNQEE